MAMSDPPRLAEVSLPAKLGEGWFLNHPIPHPQTGRGFVRIWSEAQRWQESVDTYQVQIGEGLATSVHPEAPWTIMSAQWYYLKNQWREAGCPNPLVPQIALCHRLPEKPSCKSNLNRRDGAA